MNNWQHFDNILHILFSKTIQNLCNVPVKTQPNPHKTSRSPFSTLAPHSAAVFDFSAHGYRRWRLLLMCRHCYAVRSACWILCGGRCRRRRCRRCRRRHNIPAQHHRMPFTGSSSFGCRHTTFAADAFAAAAAVADAQGNFIASTVRWKVVLRQTIMYLDRNIRRAVFARRCAAIIAAVLWHRIGAFRSRWWIGGDCVVFSIDNSTSGDFERQHLDVVRIWRRSGCSGGRKCRMCWRCRCSGHRRRCRCRRFRRPRRRRRRHLNRITEPITITAVLTVYHRTAATECRNRCCRSGRIATATGSSTTRTSRTLEVAAATLVDDINRIVVLVLLVATDKVDLLQFGAQLLGFRPPRTLPMIVQTRRAAAKQLRFRGAGGLLDSRVGGCWAFQDQTVGAFRRRCHRICRFRCRWCWWWCYFG